MDMPNLPDNSSSNRWRGKFFLKCDTWNTCDLGFFWWVWLPTRDVSGRLPNLKKTGGGTASPEVKGHLPRIPSYLSIATCYAAQTSAILLCFVRAFHYNITNKK